MPTPPGLYTQDLKKAQNDVKRLCCLCVPCDAVCNTPRQIAQQSFERARLESQEKRGVRVSGGALRRSP
eukprot:513997-Amphidinium_carterae.1